MKDRSSVIFPPGERCPHSHQLNAPKCNNDCKIPARWTTTRRMKSLTLERLMGRSRKIAVLSYSPPMNDSEIRTRWTHITLSKRTTARFLPDENNKLINANQKSERLPDSRQMNDCQNNKLFNTNLKSISAPKKEIQPKKRDSFFIQSHSVLVSDLQWATLYYTVGDFHIVFRFWISILNSTSWMRDWVM